MLRFFIVSSLLAFVLSSDPAVEDTVDEPENTQSTPPKPAKKFDIASARKVAAEILAELNTERGQEGLMRFGQSAKDVFGKKAEPGSIPYVKSVMIPVERFTKPIRQNHGLQGEFDDDMEKMRSLADKANDHQLKWQIEDIGELVKGEKDPEREGRHPELDALAEKYIDMDTDKRKEAFAAAKKIAQSEGVHPASMLYVSTMEELNGDSDFVNNQMPTIYMDMDDKEEQKQIMLNILSQFLREKDSEAVSNEISRRLTAKEKSSSKTEGKKAEL